MINVTIVLIGFFNTLAALLCTVLEKQWSVYCTELVQTEFV
jgi:hypothetical protein